MSGSGGFGLSGGYLLLVTIAGTGLGFLMPSRSSAVATSVAMLHDRPVNTFLLLPFLLAQRFTPLFLCLMSLS